MAQDPPSATRKASLDDLLTMMGITREQLRGMTAADLFAAAAQWQYADTIAAAEAQFSTSSIDRFLGSLHEWPAGANPSDRLN